MLILLSLLSAMVIISQDVCSLNSFQKVSEYGQECHNHRHQPNLRPREKETKNTDSHLALVQSRKIGKNVN